MLAVRAVLGADRFVQGCGQIKCDFALTAGVSQGVGVSLEELSAQYNPGLFCVIDQSVFQLCRRLLEFDPVKRISASEALKCEFFQVWKGLRKGVGSGQGSGTYYDGAYQKSVISQLQENSNIEGSIPVFKKRCSDISEIIQLSKSMQETLLDDYSKLGVGNLTFQKEMIKQTEKTIKKFKLNKTQISPFGHIISRNIAVFDLQNSQKCELQVPILAASPSSLIDSELSKSSVNRANIQTETRQRAVRNTAIRRRQDTWIQSIKSLIQELLVQQQKVRNQAENYRRVSIEHKLIHFMNTPIRNNIDEKQNFKHEIQGMEKLGQLTISEQLQLNYVRFLAETPQIPVKSFISTSETEIKNAQLLTQLTHFSYKLAITRATSTQENFEEFPDYVPIPVDSFVQYQKIRVNKRKLREFRLQIANLQNSQLFINNELAQLQQQLFAAAQFGTPMKAINDQIEVKIDDSCNVNAEIKSLQQKIAEIHFLFPEIPQPDRHTYPQTENFSDTITLSEEFSGMNVYESLSQAETGLSNADRISKNQLFRQKQAQKKQIRRNLRVYEGQQQAEIQQKLLENFSQIAPKLTSNSNICELNLVNTESISHFVSENLSQVLKGGPKVKNLQRIVLQSFDRKRCQFVLQQTLGSQFCLHFAKPEKLFQQQFEPSMLYSFLQHANETQRSEIRAILSKLANTCTFYVNTCLAKKDLILACQCVGGVKGVPVIKEIAKQRIESISVEDFIERYPKSYEFCQESYQRSVKNVVQSPETLNQAICELRQAENNIKSRIFEVTIEEIYLKTRQKWIDELRTGIREFGGDVVREISVGVRQNKEVRNRREILRKYVK